MDHAGKRIIGDMPLASADEPYAVFFAGRDVGDEATASPVEVAAIASSRMPAAACGSSFVTPFGSHAQRGDRVPVGRMIRRRIEAGAMLELVVSGNPLVPRRAARRRTCECVAAGRAPSLMLAGMAVKVLLSRRSSSGSSRSASTRSSAATEQPRRTFPSKRSAAGARGHAAGEPRTRRSRATGSASRSSRWPPTPAFPDPRRSPVPPTPTPKPTRSPTPSHPAELYTEPPAPGQTPPTMPSYAEPLASTSPP